MSTRSRILHLPPAMDTRTCSRRACPQRMPGSGPNPAILTHHVQQTVNAVGEPTHSRPLKRTRFCPPSRKTGMPVGDRASQSRCVTTTPIQAVPKRRDRREEGEANRMQGQRLEDPPVPKVGVWYLYGVNVFLVSSNRQGPAKADDLGEATGLPVCLKSLLNE